MKLRIVLYAVNGSGVGHLVRLTALARWMRRYASWLGVRPEIYFLSSSEASGLLFRDGFASFKLPSKTVVRDAGIDKPTYLALAKQWVWHSLGLIRPDLLIVDTFPRGSFGELLGALDLAKQRAFVYRPLKSEVSGRPDFQAMLPLYDLLLVPDEERHAPAPCPPAARSRRVHVGPVMARERAEALPRDEARARLGIAEEHVAVLVTAGGGGDPGSTDHLAAALDALAGDERTHVVVAAGPLYRGARRYGPRITWLADECAQELMPAIDLAVAGAGYNTFFELMHAGIPAVLIPQEKVADDQAARARRAASVGAARILEGPVTATRLRDALAPLLDDEEARRAASEAARALVPRNHASEGAAELLRLVLPAARVDAAEEAMTVEVLAAARELGLDVAALLDAMGALEPRPRGELAASEASALSDEAVALARHVAGRGWPLTAALRTLGPVARKLPRARVPERARAAREVLEAFAPFDDWTGAALVMRAFRSEKELPASAFAGALARFLERLAAQGADLYQGLRLLSGAHGDGAEAPSNRELLEAATASATLGEDA